MFEVNWKNVPLGHGARAKLTLFDKDLTKSEPIGTAEITEQDMQAALAAGKVYQVRVDDQTNRQLLFIAISVQAAK